MSWIVKLGHTSGFVYRRRKMRPAAWASGVTLGVALSLLSGCAGWKTALPTIPPPPMQTVACDDIAVMLRFANEAHGLRIDQRKQLIQQWEARLADPVEADCAALHLALLLSAPGSASRDRSRALELLELYAANPADKTETQLDFARYQIEQLEERERWIKAMRRERRARLDIEQKLEALKAIELRMNDLQSHGKMPLPGS